MNVRYLFSFVCYLCKLLLHPLGFENVQGLRLKDRRYGSFLLLVSKLTGCHAKFIFKTGAEIARVGKSYSVCYVLYG